MRMEQDSIRQETLPVYTYNSELLPRKLNQLHDDYERSLARRCHVSTTTSSRKSCVSTTREG